MRFSSRFHESRPTVQDTAVVTRAMPESRTRL